MELLRNGDVKEYFSSRLADMDIETLIQQDSLSLTLEELSTGYDDINTFLNALLDRIHIHHKSDQFVALKGIVLDLLSKKQVEWEVLEMLGKIHIEDMIKGYYEKNEMQRFNLIGTTEKEVLALVECQSTYELVSIQDHTNKPIGDVDLFVNIRVDKTEDPFNDIALLLSKLQTIEKDSSEALISKLDKVVNELTEAQHHSMKSLPLNL